MDVKDIRMEKACKKFISCLDFDERNVIHVSFSRINREQNRISTICTDYDWHLMYWNEDVYKSVSKRFTEGINVWDGLDHRHKEQLKKTRATQKVDITTGTGTSIDILSVATKKLINERVVISLLSLKPKVTYLSEKIWREERPKKLILPISTSPATSSGKENETSIRLDISNHSFGNITFSEKEMQTIQLLLQLKSLKEIAWFHQCSNTAERKRIELIKQKLGCSGKSASCLFEALKKYGITQACLSNYIKYQ